MPFSLKKERVAYVVMLGFMALTTLALVAASSAGGYDTVVKRFGENSFERTAFNLVQAD